ncbi:helix-turn-helix domain-containing protein [Qipengyuania flava]|jgi:excisionase family DNA binding protein|uniref:helix-turn-helix domain-containing protein n=1 Tax=Qipengyuania flava TaxID=192812 RepID=UPI00082A5D06|nr:MAG: DNA-binding protein [Citromicrobium sp.]
MLNGDLINGAAEAAKFIGITPRTVYHMVDRGELPVIRKGKRLYFRKSELEAAFRSEAA